MVLWSDLDLGIAQPVDLLERPVQLPASPESGQMSIGPGKIVSFVVKNCRNSCQLWVVSSQWSVVSGQL